MKPVNRSEQASWRRDMATLLSCFTHDAANPLINLESLIQYLKRQSDDLKVAIASGHSSNIEHLMNKSIPQAIDMMLSSSQQMHQMNTALNQLYHCHCDDLEDEWLDLNSLVQQEIDKLKVPAHLDIQMADLPSIQADSDALAAIFRALISNAVNSCREHKPARIEISCERHADALHFHITDQGCGIAAEELNKIFTPFYRGINSHGYGLGIGLCIAKTLCHRYHGDIAYAPIEPQGSRLTCIWTAG